MKRAFRWLAEAMRDLDGICGAITGNRCPDGNDRCDGTDLLHGEWCKERARS